MLSAVCRQLLRTGLSRTGESAAERFRKLQQSFFNCSIIDGDLELTYLDEPNVTYDLSFLDSVREIWGALIMYHVDRPLARPDHLLPNLRIIRGKTSCAACKNAALFVSSCAGLRALPFYSLVGVCSLLLCSILVCIRTVHLYKLLLLCKPLCTVLVLCDAEITQRDVIIKNNPNLCFVNDSIHWPELLTNEAEQKLSISDNKLTGCMHIAYIIFLCTCSCSHIY